MVMPRKNRKASVVTLESRNALLSTLHSESKLTNLKNLQGSNIEMFDSKKFTNTKLGSKPLRNKISQLSRKATSFKILKSKRAKQALEKKQKLEELRQKLKVLNRQRKYFRRYLICMHILKAGVLKLAYYIYSKKNKKRTKNRSFTILLNKDLIKYL